MWVTLHHKIKGSTQIRTEINGIKTRCDNHYTIEPIYLQKGLIQNRTGISGFRDRRDNHLHYKTKTPTETPTRNTTSAEWRDKPFHYRG